MFGDVVPKMIQIRNVPDDLHAQVKERAAAAGMTLSDFLLRELERLAARTPVSALLERHAARERPALYETAAEAVRGERDAR